MLMDLTMLVASRSTTGTPVSWFTKTFQMRSGSLKHLLVRLDHFPAQLLEILLDVIMGIQVKIDVLEEEVLVEERNDRSEFVHGFGFLVRAPRAT